MIGVKNLASKYHKKASNHFILLIFPARNVTIKEPFSQIVEFLTQNRSYCAEKWECNGVKMHLGEGGGSHEIKRFAEHSACFCHGYEAI